jgi:hypothetical protein
VRPGHTRPAAATSPEFVRAALTAFRAGRSRTGGRLAQLAFDSDVDPAPAGMIRSTRSARLLAFQVAGWNVDVEVTADGLLGQLHSDGDPAGPAGGQVIGQTVDGDFDSAELEPYGSFELMLPPPGPFRLHARIAGSTVVTSWVLLRRP